MIGLFDSNRRSSIDVQLGTSCSLILERERLGKGYITFKLRKTQIQRQSLCGYFALANAMAFCNGLDPEMLIFNERELKEHFIQIIYHDKNISMFPYQVITKVITRHTIFRFYLKNVQLTERQLRGNI